MTNTPESVANVLRMCDLADKQGIGTLTTGYLRDTLTAPRSDGEAEGQQVKRDPYAATDSEVIAEFLRVCREMKPVGQWPGEHVCAAIERLTQPGPRGFISEADRAPVRGHNGRGGDSNQAYSGPRACAAPSSEGKRDDRMTREQREAWDQLRPSPTPTPQAAPGGDADDISAVIEQVMAEWDAMIDAATHPARSEAAPDPLCSDCGAVLMYECGACSNTNYPPEARSKTPLATIVSEHADLLAAAAAALKSSVAPYTTPPPQADGAVGEVRGESTGDTPTFVEVWARLPTRDRSIISAYFSEASRHPGMGRAFQPGDRVEWQGSNGTWFAGRITEVHDRVTTYTARLEDGAMASDFAAGRFRKLAPFQPQEAK